MKISKRKFFFIRHAETEWNLRRLCQGQRDIPLNDKGMEEARALALRSQGIDMACIVSSPLKRALQTAHALQHAHPSAQLCIIPELAERGWGELEGISSEEMYAIEKREEEEPSYTPGRGVEAREAFRQRVLRGILAAQERHPHPWIVSHGRVFMELCGLLEIPLIRQVPNCQIMEFTPTDDRWILNFS